MDFDIINGPGPVKRIHAQTKYYGDTPHNPMIQEIYENMTCQDVLTYAHYIFARRTQKVRFGSKEMTLEAVCGEFPHIPARSIAVAAECGPPGRRGWRTVTLAQLLNDWYWQAKTAKNLWVAGKFHDSLKRRGVNCSI